MTTSETSNESFRDVPVEVTVTLGRARPEIGELLAMKPDTVLPLDRSIDDPVELFVGDKLIARGTLEEVDDKDGQRLAIRLTDLLSDASG